MKEEHREQYVYSIDGGVNNAIEITTSTAGNEAIGFFPVLLVTFKRKFVLSSMKEVEKLSEAMDEAAARLESLAKTHLPSGKEEATDEDTGSEQPKEPQRMVPRRVSVGESEEEPGMAEEPAQAVAAEPAPVGTRNEQLYNKAVSAGRLIEADQLSSQELVSDLHDLATSWGLGPAESTRAITSGIKMGMLQASQRVVLEEKESIDEKAERPLCEHCDVEDGNGSKVHVCIKNPPTPTFLGEGKMGYYFPICPVHRDKPLGCYSSTEDDMSMTEKERVVARSIREV